VLQRITVYDSIYNSEQLLIDWLINWLADWFIQSLIDLDVSSFIVLMLVNNVFAVATLDFTVNK
jgi:hypothetical protein